MRRDNYVHVFSLIEESPKTPMNTYGTYAHFTVSSLSGQIIDNSDM